MYIIVVGAGGIGTALVEIALRDRNNVVVIEKNQRKAEEISQRYDVQVINADAASMDVLREAGADRADALITTTHDDATNLMIVAVAGDLGIPVIVSTVNKREHTNLFHRLGAHVMENPDVIVAEYLYNAARRPKVQDLIVLPNGAHVFRATVTPQSPLVGKTLREAGEQDLIPDETLIAAIERGDEAILPTGRTVIQEGDFITVFTKRPLTDGLIERLTG